MRLAIVVVLSLSLSGCALFQEAKPEQTVTDSFCLSARKRTWSVSDSPQSIQEAEAWNSAIDRRCGVKAKA